MVDTSKFWSDVPPEQFQPKPQGGILKSKPNFVDEYKEYNARHFTDSHHLYFDIAFPQFCHALFMISNEVP